MSKEISDIILLIKTKCHDCILIDAIALIDTNKNNWYNSIEISDIMSILCSASDNCTHNIALVWQTISSSGTLPHPILRFLYQSHCRPSILKISSISNRLPSI